MAESNGTSSGKKLIRIDISSDSVCPWCFVGKRNLDKAISATKDQFDFQVCFSLFFSFLGSIVVHNFTLFSEFQFD